MWKLNRNILKPIPSKLLKSFAVLLTWYWDGRDRRLWKIWKNGGNKEDYILAKKVANRRCLRQRKKLKKKIWKTLKMIHKPSIVLQNKPNRKTKTFAQIAFDNEEEKKLIFNEEKKRRRNKIMKDYMLNFHR